MSFRVIAVFGFDLVRVLGGVFIVRRNRKNEKEQSEKRRTQTNGEY